MIAALIVTLITGSLVALFLSTVTQEARNSYRSRMAFQAVNIAEAGLEYAIYAVNNEKKLSEWTKSGKGYSRSNFPHIGFSFRNETRSARVYLEPHSTPPKAIAEGRIQSTNGMTITKQVYIELGNRSLFANGIVAKDAITFKGNGNSVDSYRSSLGPYDSVLNRNDNGTIASISIAPDIISLGNSDIWGRAASGGSALKPNPPDVGKNGSIRGKDTPAGVKVDPNRIATDFYAEFPNPSAPAMSSPATSISGATLGSTGTTTYYKLSAIDVKSKDTLTVQGNVVVLVEGDVDVKGLIQLDKTDPNASLELYATGDMDIGGNGIVNPTDKPENVMLYGLGTGTESIALYGNGAFTGVVYAPNYEVTLGGGGTSGEMMGALVAETVWFNGHYAFHYDEDLEDLSDDAAKKVTRWVELTDAAERKNMATIHKDGL